MIANNAFMIVEMKDKIKRKEKIETARNIFNLRMDIDKIVQKSGFYEVR